MTREEASSVLDDYDVNFDGHTAEEIAEAFDVAFRALEQEAILDKITEIIDPLRHLSIDEMSGIEWDILRVIDKYKAENEKT